MFAALCFLTGDDDSGIRDVVHFIKYRFIGNFNDGEVKYQDNDHEQAKPLMFPSANPG